MAESSGGSKKLLWVMIILVLLSSAGAAAAIYLVLDQRNSSDSFSQTRTRAVSRRFQSVVRLTWTVRETVSSITLDL